MPSGMGCMPSDDGIDAFRDRVDTSRDGIDPFRNRVDASRDRIDAFRGRIDVFPEGIDVFGEGIDGVVRWHANLLTPGDLVPVTALRGHSQARRRPAIAFRLRPKASPVPMNSPSPPPSRAPRLAGRQSRSMRFLAGLRHGANDPRQRHRRIDGATAPVPCSLRGKGHRKRHE